MQKFGFFYNYEAVLIEIAALQTYRPTIKPSLFLWDVHPTSEGTQKMPESCRGERAAGLRGREGVPDQPSVPGKDPEITETTNYKTNASRFTTQCSTPSN